MKIEFQHSDKTFQTDLSKPIDISIPLRSGKKNVNAWGAEPVRIEAVRNGDWIGDVKQGGSVNYRNIFFNPHGNGTHTECVGHISKENYTINACLKEFFFMARLVTMTPVVMENQDRILTYQQIDSAIGKAAPEALIIRTMPNDDSKIDFNYTGTNPIYLDPEGARLMQKRNVMHLLIDQPSVDRELDGGKLLAHRAFWNYPESTRVHSTITEMIYVPSSVPDGMYFMNIQIASFENDASPSKILIFPLKQE